MMMFGLVDVSDYGKLNGVLVCDNDLISDEIIQEKIDEIKCCLENNGQDWMIQDIIEELPSEWKIKWYNTMEFIYV